MRTLLFVVLLVGWSNVDAKKLPKEQPESQPPASGQQLKLQGRFVCPIHFVAPTPAPTNSTLPPATTMIPTLTTLASNLTIVVNQTDFCLQQCVNAENTTGTPALTTPFAVTKPTPSCPPPPKEEEFDYSTVKFRVFEQNEHAKISLVSEAKVEKDGTYTLNGRLKYKTSESADYYVQIEHQCSENRQPQCIQKSGMPEFLTPDYRVYALDQWKNEAQAECSQNVKWMQSYINTPMQKLNLKLTCHEYEHPECPTVPPTAFPFASVEPVESSSPGPDTVDFTGEPDVNPKKSKSTTSKPVVLVDKDYDLQNVAVRVFRENKDRNQLVSVNTNEKGEVQTYFPVDKKAKYTLEIVHRCTEFGKPISVQTCIPGSHLANPKGKWATQQSLSLNDLQNKWNGTECGRS